MVKCLLCAWCLGLTFLPWLKVKFTSLLELGSNLCCKSLHPFQLGGSRCAALRREEAWQDLTLRFGFKEGFLTQKPCLPDQTELV